MAAPKQHPLPSTGLVLPLTLKGGMIRPLRVLCCSVTATCVSVLLLGWQELSPGSMCCTGAVWRGCHRGSLAHLKLELGSGALPGAAHRVVVSIPRLFTAPVGRTRACDTANSDLASLDISNCLCSVDGCMDGWMHGWMSAHLFKDL